MIRRVLIVVALAFPTVASAAPPDPTVDVIVGQYVAARGGLPKLHALKTLRQKGRVIAPGGHEGVVLRELKKPGKIRFEFKVQGITGVYVVEGGKGWQVSPFDGDMAAQPMADEAVTEAMEQADVEGPLVDWRQKGHRVELVGHEFVDGRDAYKLKVTLKSGDVRYEYIDAKTSYPLRTDSTRLIRGRDVHLVTTFTGHTKTGGILFPRQLDVATEGRPQRLRVVVDEIEVNPKIGDERFRRPASRKLSPQSATATPLAEAAATGPSPRSS